MKGQKIKAANLEEGKRRGDCRKTAAAVESERTRGQADRDKTDRANGCWAPKTL